MTEASIDTVTEDPNRGVGNGIHNSPNRERNTYERRIKPKHLAAERKEKGSCDREVEVTPTITDPVRKLCTKR